MPIGAKIAEPITIFASHHQFFGKKARFYSFYDDVISFFLQKNVVEIFLDCRVIDLLCLFAILCTNIPKN